MKIYIFGEGFLRQEETEVEKEKLITLDTLWYRIILKLQQFSIKF